MKRIFTIGFLLFIITCKQPYIPPPILAHHHYLVVEGFINAGIGSTVITLTRTRDLTDTGYLTISGVTDSIFVLGATVTVEDKLGNSFVLPEMGKGQYGGIQLNLNPQGQYRLLIKTKDGSEYASSWSPVLPPPLIDSVYWRLEGDGVHIYTDVSGDNSSSRYYRMTYEATWEFHTSFHSSLIYDHSDTSFLMRSPQKYVDTCWRTTVPTNILIGTTTGLSENFLSKAPLQFIPLHSEALSVLYSILVKVYSTSKPEYQFWNLLMKNTENTGSLFDPQPSTITGNIQCLSNPAEPVIGYVGVGIPAEKRIWINNSELPISWNGNGNFYECSSFQIVNDKDSIAKYFEEPVQLFAAVKAVKDLQGDTLGYEITRRRCADCTQRGTTQRPPFWP